MPNEREMNDLHAKCPFFRRHMTQCIICEGVVLGTTDKIAFDKGGRKQKHYDQYCCASFESCPRYLHLMTKYKEE